MAKMIRPWHGRTEKETVKEKRSRLSNNIRRYRKLAGYSQSQLGEFLNLSRNMVCNYELGHSEPMVTVALAIANALHTSVESLYEPARVAGDRPGQPRSHPVLWRINPAGEWVQVED